MITGSQTLSVTEKIGYSLNALSANLVFQTLMTYLAYFYTDIYGLQPNHASAVILTVGLVAGYCSEQVGRVGKFFGDSCIVEYKQLKLCPSYVIQLCEKGYRFV